MAYKIQTEKEYHHKKGSTSSRHMTMIGENGLLGPCIILRQEAAEGCNLAEH
jgi:hypothetical protein